MRHGLPDNYIKRRKLETMKNYNYVARIGGHVYDLLHYDLSLSLFYSDAYKYEIVYKRHLAMRRNGCNFINQLPYARKF